MFTNLLLSRHNFLFSIRWKDCYIYIRKYSYAEIQSCTLTAIDIIVTTIPFNRAGSKVIFIDVINLDRDLDQLQAAISHSKNSSRSETIQLFDKNHFYFLEHPPTKAELLNSMVGKGRTWPNQSQQYSCHSASNVIDGIQVGCPCCRNTERYRLGRRPSCEIRLPVFNSQARLCEYRVYLWLIAGVDGSDRETGTDSE